MECEICGTRISRYPSGFGEVVLCGDECRAGWLSDAFTGKGHPNWKGGGSELYGQGWRRAKLETLARDNHTCRICGTSKEELGRNPDVHHIVPVRTFVDAPVADKTDAHVPRNLVTLCIGCHRRADFGQPWKARLKGLISDRP
jgi:5-methylcytosine-specific restriction endonuclease McrA